MDWNDGLTVRQGWRMAGIRAELEYLARRGFTGRVEYTMNGGGVVRKLVELGSGGPLADAVQSIRESEERLRRWAMAPQEARLVVYFTKGRAKRIET